METVPLLKLLMAAGLGSRRKLAEAIKQGRVSVNGEVVDGFAHPVNPDADVVSMDGQAVKTRPEAKLVLIFNKPAGLLSTTDDDRGRSTVIDKLPEKYRHMALYPVGRLDKDTTGLLLLTNDGDLTYQLTHPKFEHEKEYLVLIKGKLLPAEKAKLEKGILLDDGMTYPAVLREITKYPPFNYSITIHEGRKRQVHRMFAKIGYLVLALKRVRIGGLELGNMGEGAVREISDKEIKQLIGPR
jgi:23S rRNA pseudouridine2605 synthase